MAEPILTVEHLIKAYGETPVLDDISFAVKPGEVIVVVGPSGCGKSTLLRCLNGLEPTQSGRVRLGNETVAYGGKNLTQLRQRIGMVFQSYELFPHMTVLDNVLLAPTKVQKRPKAEVQQEYMEHMATLLKDYCKFLRLQKPCSKHRFPSCSTDYFYINTAAVNLKKLSRQICCLQ